MPFDLAAYFDRIGLSGCSTDLLAVKSLQRAQIAAIPFENVQPFLGEVPVLDLDSIWQKLVVRKCGGYCFELNALLGAALEEIGFSSRKVLARVRMGAKQGGARTHLAFVVTLDGVEWLVDAGFGGQTPREPVCISTGDAQQIGDHVFRIRFEDASTEHVLERRSKEGWFPLFGFDRVEVRPADVYAANHLCATSPHESFAANMKFFRQMDGLSISYLNGRARFTDKNGMQERQILTEDDLKAFMREDLGLGYNDEIIEKIVNRLKSLKHQPS